MRITLDKAAMEVLLSSMSVEARADFSKRVMKQVVEKLTKDLTEQQFTRALDEFKATKLNEYLDDVKARKPKLSSRERQKVADAFDDEIEALIGQSKAELKKQVAEAHAHAIASMKTQIRNYTQQYMHKLIQGMAQQAIADHLDSLIELGNALKSAQSATPWSTDESN